MQRARGLLNLNPGPNPGPGRSGQSAPQSPGDELRFPFRLPVRKIALVIARGAVPQLTILISRLDQKRADKSVRATRIRGTSREQE